MSSNKRSIISLCIFSVFIITCASVPITHPSDQRRIQQIREYIPEAMQYYNTSAAAGIER